MKEKVKNFFTAVNVMPYKPYWIIMMGCSILLFSWVDEIAIWGVGLAWDWRIVPLYYVVEYGIFLPLLLYLGKKSFEKINRPLPLRSLLKQSLRNMLPLLIYRKLKEKVTRNTE